MTDRWRVTYTRHGRTGWCSFDTEHDARAFATWGEEDEGTFTDARVELIAADGGTPLIPGPETGNIPTPSPDLTTGRAPTHRAGEPPTHPR